MNKTRMARLLASAWLLVVAPVAFAQLADREVVAGGTYTEQFKVLCLVGGGGASRAQASIGEVDLRVQILPSFFPIDVEPKRVSVGSIFRLTANVPFDAPARPYQITILGIGASEAACSGISETFNLFVRRPVELSVTAPTQILFPASSNDIEVKIRRRTNFMGPVRLATAGLPTAFGMSFNPQETTGNRSILNVRVPETTTQCLPPQGCRVEIKGTAPGGVQVEPAEVQIVVLGQVSLVPDQTMAMVEPGKEAVFRLDVKRLNYTGTVNLAVTATEQPAGGKFTTRIEPQTLTTEPAFTLGIKIDPSAPGQYKFQVKAANTGQTEPPVTLTVQTVAPSLIVVTPESRTVNLGRDAEYDIMAASQVTLGGVRADKPGVTGSVDPAAKKLKVQTTPATPVDSYQLFVMGTVPREGGGTDMIEAKPVTLVVQAAPEGAITIKVPSGVRRIPPGFQTRINLEVQPMGQYAGRVEILIPPILPGGVTARFMNNVNVVEFDGTNSISKDVILFLTAADNALPTGVTTILVNSSLVPDASRNTPSIEYMVTEPQLTFSNIDPPESDAYLIRGPFRLRANINRNGCSSPVVYDYTDKNILDIALPFDMNIDTMVKPRLSVGSVFRLTVTAVAAGCLPASFTLSGTISPLMTIPALVTATLAPAGQTIQRGQSAAYTLTVNRGDTQGPINVAVTGLPPGVTAMVVPNPITGSTAQVTLNTTSSTPAGTYTFTVTASANGAPIATATAGLVVVATSGTPPPAISFFTPAGALPGTPVQITGTNFIGVQNVLFNGTGTPFATIGPMQINTSVPGFATTGPITVITAGGVATSALPFVVSASPQLPQITSFSPTGGPAGTAVRLMGVNLAGVIDVSMGTPAFGFSPIPFTPFDPTRVDVIIPPGAVSGFFRVTTLSGTATSGTAFNVTTPNLPEVGGFSPISGPAGTRVQIIGSNLAGATQVTFAGVSASFEPPQQNSIFATVPPGAMTGQIRVTTPAGTATSFASFAVTSGGPVITDFQPQMGQVGFSVTIAGANLSGTNQVMFNGTPAAIGIITPNFVQVFVPPGATSGPIRLVTSNGEATSSLPFMVMR